MYNPSFPSTNSSQNENPSFFSDVSNYDYNINQYDQDFQFLEFDYPMVVDDNNNLISEEISWDNNCTILQDQEPFPCLISTTQAPLMDVTQAMGACSYGSSSSSHNYHLESSNIECENAMKRAKFVRDGHEISLSTDSDFQNSFDGYNWMNYTKKIVNNSPNPSESKKMLKRPAEMGEEHAIAFRTKSEFENLDDGYKWRKYGKKIIKSSPNPRNYYKCANEGCKVKKRVERDQQDQSYVITSYEGIHNHESPSVIYCHPMQLPFISINNWTNWQP